MKEIILKTLLRGTME